MERPLTTDAAMGQMQPVFEGGPTRTPVPPKGGMAGWRLARVTGYMAAHLGRRVSALDLVAVSGLSRAQFFRAFRQSTGLTPQRYLARRRQDQASERLTNAEGGRRGSCR